VLGKSLRVDHVQNYKPPKDNENYDDITRQLHSEGCAPKLQIPETSIKQETSKSSKQKASTIEPDLRRVKSERKRSSSRDKVFTNLLFCSRDSFYHKLH
jgi:RNA-binding motif protein, X-linked 2